MPSPSNLYAEKIFSEHPIVLWSLDDEFATASYPVTLTFEPFNSEFYGIKTFAYGLEDNYGYYIRDGDIEYAKNDNIPMVYGAANVTTIYPIDSETPTPSLILPANGFMHNSGRYKTLTAEMWLRITANTDGATGIYTKIFGPLTSDDGLYVHDSFLMLKIGNNIRSHYVGEWERPMLVQISTGASSANLLVNGELAFTMPYDYSFSYADDSTDSWLGFYARSTYVRLVEVDCVAIYPYEVTPVIAKRRFIYGQAIDYPENVNVAYNGISAFVDYSFANYSTNYSYPKNAKWSNGIQNNALTSGDFLTSPNYELPNFHYTESGQVYTNVIGWDQLQASKQSSVHPEKNLMKFKDATGNGYFKLDSLKVLENGLGAIAIHIVTASDTSTTQSVYKIINKISGDYLEAIIEDDAMHYVSYINKETYDSTDFGSVSFSGSVETPLVVGLDIAKAKNFDGLYLSTFFDDLENLAMYIGGTEATTATYKGWYEFINLFGIDSESFTSDADGSVYESYPDFAGYSLRLNKVIDGLYVDIATKSYWQDYIPLTYLAKPMTIDNAKTYAIDFIQYNANIVVPTTTGDQYFQNGQVRSYVSLQKIANPISSKEYEFESSYGLLSSGVQTITEENKLYSVADNSIITIDDSFNIDEYALYLHIWIYNPGTLKNPVTIKNLELSSKTFEGDTATIGTRFGVNLESFRDTALNYFKIYKSSSPHLYLTNKTGIELTGGGESSGVSLKLNYFDAPSYYLSGIQMAIKYTKTEFPNGATLLFSIVSNNDYFKVYINNSMSAPYSTITMKVVNPDNSESDFTDVEFFLNGHIVETPTINIKEWNMFGIRFKGLVLFNETSQAYLKLLGPMLFNNVSTYRLGEIESSQKFVYNTWDSLTTSTWGDIDGEIWKDQLYSSIQLVNGVDLSQIYRVYLGTNKINVVNNEYSQFDESITQLNGYKYILYTDTKWQSLVTKPL
jgi:hypothetical protein